MNRTSRLFTALCFLTSTVALGASAVASVIQSYATADDPYLGRVDVRIEIPGVTRVSRESGTATAYFTRTENGQTRLVVSGSIREDSDNGFTADGIESETGWNSLDEDLTIRENGTIIGGKTDQLSRLSFDGFVSEARFDLEVEHELVEGNENGLPPGTRFLYNYTLRREVIENANDTTAPEEAGSGNRECRRTVLQTRNVANLSGGPMIMVQVPVCVN